MNTTSHCLRLFTAFASLICVTGCNTILVQSEPQPGTLSYPPTDWHMVQVLNTQPATPYEKLADITLQPTHTTARRQIDEKLQREAAKMGAEAVVFISDQNESVVSPGGERFTRDHFEARLVRAEAIRYTN